jgi:hypothetical protein
MAQSTPPDFGSPAGALDPKTLAGVRAVMSAFGNMPGQEILSTSEGDVEINFPPASDFVHHLKNAPQDQLNALAKKVTLPPLDNDGSLRISFHPQTNDIPAIAETLRSWSDEQTFRQTLGSLPGAQVSRGKDGNGADALLATFSSESAIAKSLARFTPEGAKHESSQFYQKQLGELNAATSDINIGLGNGPNGSVVLSVTPQELRKTPQEKFDTVMAALTSPDPSQNTLTRLGQENAAPRSSGPELDMLDPGNWQAEAKKAGAGMANNGCKADSSGALPATTGVPNNKAAAPCPPTR